MSKGESLLIIESDNGDGWTRWGSDFVFYLYLIIYLIRVKRERGDISQPDEGRAPTSYLEITLYDPKYAKAKKKSEYSNC